MKKLQPSKPQGRPRSFDRAKALEAAMKEFWQRGYEGTSLANLTAAMGINRPSIYAAFGDKAALFREALDRYERAFDLYSREALNEPTARGAVERLLQGVVEFTTRPRYPRGCLLLNGGLTCGEGTEAIRVDLNRRRSAGEKALRRRLERAQAESDLKPDTDAADLARYFATVIRGIGVQAASGATRAELRRVVQTALRAWPE
jgi:AcrR family transcriptional regulator